jgi:hypothetical protein
VVVKIIQKDGTASSTCWNLVRRIRQFLEHGWKIKIQHFYREVNKCADMLANIECDSRCSMIYYEILSDSFLLLILRELLLLA